MKIQNKLPLIAFAVLVLLAVGLKLKEGSAASPIPEEDKNIQADTLIPQGFVLVPVELANVESVAAFIDHYGVIDLYGGGSEASSALVAAQLKILRAPLNPNQYAVLATEEVSKSIMKAKGPFWAVVHNRFAKTPIAETKTAAKPQPAPAPPPSRPTARVEIEYYQGDAK